MGRGFLAFAFLFGSFLAVVSGAGGLDTSGCGKTKGCLFYTEEKGKKCSSMTDCDAIVTVSKKKGRKVPVDIWVEKKEREGGNLVAMGMARHLGNGEPEEFYGVVCDFMNGEATLIQDTGEGRGEPFPGAKIDKDLRTCRFNFSLDWVPENAFEKSSEEYVVGFHFVGSEEDREEEEGKDFIIVNFAADLESVSDEGKKTPKKTTEATKTEVTKGKITTETSKVTTTKGAVKSSTYLFPIVLSLATLAPLTTHFLC